MVQKGYWAACAACVSVSALKSVDLPTLGRPTMPQRKPIALSLSPIGERSGSGEVLPDPVNFDYADRMFPASYAYPPTGPGLRLFPPSCHFLLVPHLIYRSESHLSWQA